MTDSTTELESAFDNLFKAVESTVQSVKILAHSLIPVSTFLQVSENTLEVLKSADASNILMNSANLGVLKKPISDLSEIQVAATKTTLETNSSIAKTLSKDALNIVKNESSFKSPQSSLAEFINDSVTFYNDVNSSISTQAGDINTISSAYNAWLQNTLFTLSQPVKA